MSMNDNGYDDGSGQTSGASQKPNWSQDQVNGWYNQYLGHDAGAGWNSWSDHGDAESAIKNSAEAQAYKAKQGNPAQSPMPPVPVGNPGAQIGQPTPAATPQPGAGLTSAPNNQQAIDAFWKDLTQSGRQSVTPQELSGMLANPAYGGLIKLVPGSTDKVQLPNGQIVDAIQDQGGLNKPAWGISGGQQGENGQGVNWNAGTGTGGSSGGSSGSGVSGTTGSSFGGSTSSTTIPQMDQLMQLLTSRANGSLNIDPKTDPIIRPQVDDAAAQTERERRTYLSDLAESSNPYATGSLNTAATQTAEKAGQANSTLQTQLVQNELTQRRGEIQNAISTWGSLLTSQQQMTLQRELAQIDAGLRQQQITSGNDQFMADLGLKSDNQANYWDSVRSGLL